MDMVVVCGDKKMAIECDGERYHSGEDKIREDMERQTILERLGWRFIRIRGSEYYRNPEKTMERVVTVLTNEGIEPEQADANQECVRRNTELLQRVKQRAYEILHENDAENEDLADTIAAALDPKNDVIGATLQTPLRLNVSECHSNDSVNLHSELERNVPNASEEDDHSNIKAVENADHKGKTAEIPGDQVEQISFLNMLEPEEKATDATSGTADILQFLRDNKIRYIDKRANGGSLWIIGGWELSDVVAKARAFGYTFRFKKDGGRTTQNRPAWWAK